MEELLEQLLNEFGQKGLMAILKVYKAVEQGREPNDEDVKEGLYLLEEYYQNYLDWYRKYKPKAVGSKLYNDFKKRHVEIYSALHSKNPTLPPLSALDNGINQWHIDYPVLAHLEMEFDKDVDEEASKAITSIIEEIFIVLEKLGRLPKDSTYTDKDEINNKGK